MYGREGDDVLNGPGDGHDVLWGEAGDDSLIDGGGLDVVFDGSGDDRLHSRGEFTRLQGGLGTDSIVADAPSGWVVSGGGRDAASSGDQLDYNGFDWRGHFAEQERADSPTGETTATLTVTSGPVHVLLDYNERDGVRITVNGYWVDWVQTGDDYVVEAGKFLTEPDVRLTIALAGGNDTIESTEALRSRGIALDVRTGEGNDFVSLGHSVTSSRLGRLQTDAGHDHVFVGAGFEMVDGGDGDDTIVLTHTVATLGGLSVHGGEGDDRIEGSDFDDQLFGDAGNDTLLGGLGDNTIDAGSGNDLLDSGTGDDHLIGLLGINAFVHGDGRARIGSNAATGESILIDPNDPQKGRRLDLDTHSFATVGDESVQD